MIAKMAKYDFVLYAAQSEDFIEKLRELGLVDITTTGWEPSEEDRQLLLDIEGHTKAADFLRNFRAGEGRFEAGAKPFASGAEAYEHYAAAHQKATALAAEIARLEKSADELRPWGEFSPERTKALASQGIVLRYFFTPKSNYDKFGPEWSERYTLSLINRTDSTAYFVVVTAPGEDVTLDAPGDEGSFDGRPRGGTPYRRGEAGIAGSRRRILARGGFGEVARGTRCAAEGTLAGRARESHGAAGRRRYAGRHGGLGREGDLRQGRRPCWRRIPMSFISRETLRPRTIRP